MYCMIFEKYAYKIVQIAIINVHKNKTYTSTFWLFIFIHNATDSWKMQCHKIWVLPCYDTPIQYIYTTDIYNHLRYNTNILGKFRLVYNG